MTVGEIREWLDRYHPNKKIVLKVQLERMRVSFLRKLFDNYPDDYDIVMLVRPPTEQNVVMGQTVEDGTETTNFD